MQDAKFSRGGEGDPGLWLDRAGRQSGCPGKLPHEKYYHLFEPLPSFLQVEALIDRLHYYLPGLGGPEDRSESASRDYGFINTTCVRLCTSCDGWRSWIVSGIA